MNGAVPRTFMGRLELLITGARMLAPAIKSKTVPTRPGGTWTMLFWMVPSMYFVLFRWAGEPTVGAWTVQSYCAHMTIVSDQYVVGGIPRLGMFSCMQAFGPVDIPGLRLTRIEQQFVGIFSISRPTRYAYFYDPSKA